MQHHSHQQWESRFCEAIETRSQTPPAGLFDGTADSRQAGWQVYLNNATHSLGVALADTFPVCQALVGETFFKITARAFTLQTLPTSPVLHDYGHTFPAFLREFKPAATVPCLPDIAALEFAWLQSYHAADTPPLSHSILANTAPQNLSPSCIKLHPSLYVLPSDYPVCEIWHAHQKSDAEYSDINMNAAECAMIFRHHNTVFVMSISTGMTTFFSALQNNIPLAEAAAKASNSEVHFDLQSALSLLLMYDLIVGLDNQPDLTCQIHTDRSLP